MNISAKKILTISMLMLFLSVNSTAAKAKYPDIYKSVSIDVGVPVSILWNMALQESRRQIDGEWTPWPWTVNHAGDSHYFESKEEAVNFVQRKLTGGAKPISIDMGLLQGNYHYNKKYIDEIGIVRFFEPKENITFAAKKLRSCKDRGNTFTTCIGLYYNSDPEKSAVYKANVAKRMKGE